MNDHTNIEVSIIIVSYNTCEMTLDALRSVTTETHTPTYELLVVDNNSSDGSAEAIAKHIPEAKLFALEENIGFAGANNLAAKKARGRFILLLNPDTVVLNGAIEHVIEFAKANMEAKIWGGRTVYGDGNLNPYSCWGQMTLWNTFCRTTGLAGIFPKSEFFNSETYGAWPRDIVRHVDIVTGCFFLIERNFWNELGGFDPAFFMYGEEADLCLRAKAVGAHPLITPKATLVHYGGASENTQSGKMIKLLAAKATLIKRHFPSHQVQLALALLQAWPLSRWLVLRLFAMMPGGGHHLETAKTWHAVWQQREKWKSGWSLDHRDKPTNNSSNVTSLSTNVETTAAIY
ncbi:MAG: glycosyltransferase family 2 protein [Hyphomicrobiaceae bacterium]